MADSKPKLYTAWFCPFAQRAWIAMLAKKVDFEYIDQDPYNKTPEWMAVSPTGKVPVIVHNGNTIYESAICIEYIDEAFPTDVLLLPKDPFKRAFARIWGDILGKGIIPHFFEALMKKTKEEQDEALENFQNGLKTFFAAMDPNSAFLQGETIGYLDIMLAPFANLIQIMLKHFRRFEVPNNPEFARFHKWWEVAMKHPAIAPTLYPAEQYISRYEKQFMQS
jgi:glutathione S-transferase